MPGGEPPLGLILGGRERRDGDLAGKVHAHPKSSSLLCMQSQVNCFRVAGLAPRLGQNEGRPWLKAGKNHLETPP